MSIYAIGVVREETGEVRVRLIDPDKLKYNDVRIPDLGYYINRPDGIKNLALNKKGELQWKQGASDRYPIIDKMTGSIRNQDAAIVLGVADTGVQKYYRICNCNGATTIVKASDLIAYGKMHQISNCKIVKKGNTEYIAAIEGSIDTIDTKPKFQINGDLGYLSIHIPFIMSDELVIPEIINGRPIFDVESIKVTPESSALQIRKLTISKYLKKITMGLFVSLRNLEEIHILGENVDVYDDAFTILRNLKKLHFNSIHASGANICQGLKYLEEVKCDTPIEFINSGAFSGCQELKVDTVLVEGVKAIGTKAFFGNKVNKHLVIPSTITSITDNAFEKNTSLTEVDVKTEILNISTNTRSQTKGLFAGRDKVKMFVNKHCVLQEKMIAENVEVIRREANEFDKKIEKKIQRGNILGVSLEATKLISNPKEVADVFVTATQEEITNTIQDLINQKLKYQNVWRVQGEYNLSGFKIGLYLNGCNGLYTSKKMKNIGKYIVLMGKNLIFYPIDRELLRNQLLTKCSYTADIRPAFAESKNIKSVDIGNDGTIRLIYEKNGTREIKYIKDFSIEE